jgi:beta-mannanase
VGKAPSIVPFNLPFEGCSTSCNDYTFPLTQMDAVNAYGAITMLNWSSMSSPLQTNEPAFNLANVANGAFDSYITSFAQAAKQWGHPFLLRFDWEMNGNWFPWGSMANGNTAAEFVAAWRHVHDIFTSVGATNATWVWCPNVDFENQFTSLAKLYPGDNYVDWTCMDGYNDGNTNGAGGWRSFNQIFASTYQKITALAPTKPMLIGETGSSETGGSKAGWITDMFNQLPNYPNLHGLVYYDQYSGGYDWPLETSQSAINAFKAGIANPAYQPNDYANRTGSILTP